MDKEKMTPVERIPVKIKDTIVAEAAESFLNGSSPLDAGLTPKMLGDAVTKEELERFDFLFKKDKNREPMTRDEDNEMVDIATKVTTIVQGIVEKINPGLRKKLKLF
jgi:hypothetical protein